MAGDWHLGFSGVITIVESEATNDGGFFDGDWGMKLGGCHSLFFVTRPSNIEPLMSLASILSFSMDAIPRSG